MNKAIFTLTLLLLASFSLPVMGQGGKSVDLSTSEVWPALKGDIPNASITDGTYTYYGGHKYIPKHFFDGFSTIGLPVNHPGAESITFDWQLQLTQDPNGAATVVYDQTNEFTLSTGESDVITFGEPINYTQPGNYLLEADISSANDPAAANNHAEFVFDITEEVYGFADKNNMTGSYNVFGNSMAASGDGLGIVLDVPATTGAPIVLNSLSIYVKNELPEVIENGNAQLIAVLWEKDSGTGEWNFLSGSLVQSAQVALGTADLDSEVTLPFEGGFQFQNSGEYLAMVHMFNGGDPTNDGAIVIGADPNGQAPSDLSRILLMSGSVNYIAETPGIWANFAPGEGAVSNAAEILTYALPGQTDATINSGAGTISVQLPQGSDVTNLAADFTLSAGATAEVGTTTQESGVTTNDFSSPVVYTVTAEDGTTTKDWTVTVTVAASAAAEILTYALPGQTDATINSGAGTISVQLPQGSDVTNLAADFTLSAGATAEVGTTTQESGVTTNDFSSPVVYTVTAEDGTTTKDWTVTVTVEPSSDAKVLAFEIAGQVQSSISNPTSNISVLMPQGTDISNLIAEFVLSDGASATISSAAQESGVTANNFINPVTYTVTAEDGETTRNWTVLVNTMNTSATAIIDFSFPSQVTDAIFSGNEITVYMPQPTDVTALVANFVLATGASAKVNGVTQESGVTANDFTDPVTYTVTAYDCVTTEDWTVTVEIYTPSEGDFVEFELENQHKSVINPGNRTIAVEVFDNADITSLVATFSVAPGAVVKVDGVVQESGVTANDYTDDVNYQIDGPSGNVYTWTVIVTQLPADEAELLTFSIPNQIDGFINNSQNTVEVIMPPGTDISQLIPEFSVSIGATIAVGGVAQQSGQTVNDFTDPLTYTITAADGVTTEQWQVTVIEQSSDANILTYSIPNQVSSTIDEETNEINVTMPAGTDVTALIAEFTLSEGAVAHIEDVEQESGVTENNFTNPVTYTVTAADGVTTAQWVVTVDVEIPDVGILSYSISGELSNTMDDAQQRIDILMPAGTDITSLVAEFTLTDGATAKVGGVEQESGVTENDFTDPVTYTVTASDGVTTAEWEVTVDVEIPDVGILTYSIPGEISNTISDSEQQIDIEMPAGTDVSSLVAEFTLTEGAVATVGGVEQVSGETVNDFTNEVIYTVTASDGVTYEEWSVFVTTAAAEAEFNSFTIPGQVNSVINSTAASIDITMPIGSDLSVLVPQFTLSEGAIATVDGIVQESGVSANNFTQSVEYLVTAIDDNDKLWTVTVTEEQSSPADFLNYSINGVDGQIDVMNAYIRVELPAGTDLTSLVATYQVVDGTNVRIGSTAQESGVTPNNFTEIVKYRLIPESGQSRYWRVKVAVEGDMNNGTNILYYGFYGQTNPADINETTRTISVNLDPQLDVSQLIPMFYLSEGAIAYVGEDIQWSGQSLMNFTEDVVYTIVAEDGQTQSDWTVEVTTDQNASTNILAFSVEGVPADEQYTTIYATTRTVYVDVPAGTSRENMVAQFQLSSGATASIDGMAQESGVTVNNFVRPVIYTVTAQNGTNQNDWTVAVRHYVGTYEFIEPKLAVYPNPASDFLNIAVPAEYLHAVISVVSMKGEVLMNVNSDGLTNQIDVSSLTGGLYLIVVQAPHKQWVEKVMIE